MSGVRIIVGGSVLFIAGMTLGATGLGLGAALAVNLAAWLVYALIMVERPKTDPLEKMARIDRDELLEWSRIIREPDFTARELPTEVLAGSLEGAAKTIDHYLGDRP